MARRMPGSTGQRGILPPLREKCPAKGHSPGDANLARTAVPGQSAWVLEGWGGGLSVVHLSWEPGGHRGKQRSNSRAAGGWCSREELAGCQGSGPCMAVGSHP